MGLFKRKYKSVSPIEGFKIVSNDNLPLLPFGENIDKSDVVKVCIDRIATHASKLKMVHIKKGDGSQIEKKGNLSFILKHKPNEYMTPSQFLYKVVSLLLLNDNAFIYPLYDEFDGTLRGIYPLKPNVVEPIVYDNDELVLKMIFDNGQNYIIPYENIIHLKKFYTKHDLFGGSTSNGDNKAILKTVKMNDALLQGVERAMFSSFQIKGLLKINGMLKESDKQKQIDEFNRMLLSSMRSDSAIVPIDGKAEYVPLVSNPQIVDPETLRFVQSKILNYFGVSIEIFNNSYNEDNFNSFYESVIEPIAIGLSESFSNGLLSNNQLKNGEEIIFFSERLQYASWNTKVGAIEKLMGLGIMSLNESRALLGLEPIEGGDKRLQSLNYVDASKANLYQVNEEEDKNGQEN